MALTLPYPDMDFVPLDILTAAEQDQLVANIEYIANQFPVSSIADNSIDTAQIKDGAVTSDKIDFTTLRAAVTSTTSSIVIPAGKWLVIHQLGLNQTSVSAASVYIYRLTNVDTNTATWAMPPGSGQNVFDLLTRFNVVTFNSTTTCSLSATTSSNVTATSNKWVAIPIN